MTSIGTRRTRQSRRQQRLPLVIDTETSPPSTASDTIDLTSEDTSFVDLTNVIDSPVVITGSPERRRALCRHLTISSGEESDGESLPDLNQNHRPNQPQDQRPDRAVDVEPSGPAEDCMSPTQRLLSCPICFDSDRQIKSSGRHMMSTICGHIFCDLCLRSAVQSQQRCPTCRKRLTLKQIHTIFI